jgi:hypothetical protein
LSYIITVIARTIFSPAALESDNAGGRCRVGEACAYASGLIIVIK